MENELKIEYLPIKSLKPYEKNARKHDRKSVDAIANSIEAFGFDDPIGIWGDNYIVEGHGRLAAAKKLGMDKVPCVRLDHLTDEERRAYTLAHNKTAEVSEWDFETLAGEIADLENIDFSVFGFDEADTESEDDDDDGYYGDERERTFSAANLAEYNESRTAGYYQFPTIERCDYVPSRLIGFNYVKTATEYDCGVHFFLDDYQFERVWNNPRDVIPRMERFECVLTPDFSLYLDMPRAMKVWNVYRARLIGQMMQDRGYKVIPTVSWAEKETYDFCFDGLPTQGTIAVSTVGVMRDKEAREIWCDGMTEALKRLKPKTVLCYGTRIDYDFGDTSVKYYDAREFGGA